MSMRTRRLRIPLSTKTIFLALVFGAAHPVWAKWYRLENAPADWYQGIHFVNSNTGYVVSWQGQIHKTTDGGSSWTTQASAGVSLEGVHFPVDATTGYVVGRNDTIMKTTNGGTNWSFQNSGTSGIILRDLWFPVDATTGYVAGNSGTILKTIDGGSNWTPQSSGTTEILTDVHFPVDANTGYVVGTGGSFLKTINGGATWTAQNLGYPLRSVYFPVDATVGYVGAEGGALLKTTDGGANWTPLNSGTTGIIESIHFPVDTTTGYLVVSGDHIRKTTDGGLTWVGQPGPTGPPKEVHFPQDATIGYAAATGTVLKTVNGGATQVALHPTGVGSANGFTSQTGCLATSHWDCANDQPLNAGVGPAVPNDGTTSYLADGSGNLNREMFSLDDGTVPANATITGIEVFAQLGEGAGSTPYISLSYQRMGTDASPVDSANIAIPNSTPCCTFQVNNFWNGLTWSTAELNALEVGIKHQAGGVVSLSQLYVVVSYEEPTAVALVSFTATGFDGGVFLEWETGSELDNLGFYLYRSIAEEGPYERLTASVIPGLGSSPQGARYSYTDTGLTNGVTYFYNLEDIETTGRRKLHGPVEATPQAGVALTPEPSPEPSGEVGGSARITYGDPQSNGLRVLKQGRSQVVLELRTEGFHAEPQEDGTVRLEIPDFVEVVGDTSPSIPVRRTWVEALAGRKVELVSVVASEEDRIEGLRPTSAAVPEIEASVRGTVWLRRGYGGGVGSDEHALLGGGLYPEEWARVLEVGFQGEVKKALVELSPLRWKQSTGRLVLARRLVARLAFTGREPLETALGGSRGRRPRARWSERKRSVVAGLVTVEKGLYGARYEEVLGGRGRSIPLGRLRLSRQGETVAYHVEPTSAEAPSFGPGSTLYFFSGGEKANSYGREAFYELELGEPGETMEVISRAPWGEAAGFYWETVEREENRFYQAGLLDAPDVWLWDLVMSGTRTSYRFQLSDLAGVGEAAAVRVWLQGASDLPSEPDHHVRVVVNGVGLQEGSWEGKKAERLEGELPPGVLREGENVLEIENAGDTGAAYSMVMLDRFEARYPHRLEARGGILEGEFSETGVAEVTGLSPEGYVVDVTEGSPKWLDGVEGTPEGLVRFGVVSGHRYRAVSPEGVLRPEVRRVGRSDLRNEWTQADYVVIGPAEFLPAAGSLLELRESQGLVVKAVSIEEVYSEFGYGEQRPEAVRDFLAYAYHRWRKPSPRYVLLLGDATYDYKDYLKTGVMNRVPPLMVKTSYLWTVSDPAYAAVNGEDLLPDVAIGRLPAASVEEARSLVEKIVEYETGEAHLSAPLVLVADNPDDAGDFVANAEELVSGVLSGREVRRVYLSDLGTEATQRGIVDGFNEGASLLSYIGHGGIHLWADENLLNIWQVGSLSPQLQQPLLLTMNCLNGYFHFPHFNSLSEELVKARGKGAIAAFSPSGLSLNTPAHVLHNALLTELFHGDHERLGDAVLAAQEAYVASGAFPELLTIYHVIGDPALRLH